MKDHPTTSGVVPGRTEAATPDAAKTDLLGLRRAELATALAPWIDHRFRIDQVYRGIHERGVRDLTELTELGKDLRATLADRFVVGVPQIAGRTVSEDGTRKLLLRLVDGATIESVDIPEAQRRTFCLSSQAGCALGCTFCVTGYWGAGRNLTAGEILGQVAALREELPADEPAANVVFMGMGEPLLNLEAVRAAVEILGESVSLRRITVSTAGVVPGIEAMARWPRRPNLAVSLHAPDDQRRSRLMPIGRSYPLAELLDALNRFPLERGRRLTFEYILIRDLNDRPSDARALGRLLAGLRAKVNLIPVNPDPVLGERMAPPAAERIEEFRRELAAAGLVATVRRPRGVSVSAACGQLRAPERPPRGRRQISARLRPASGPSRR